MIDQPVISVITVVRNGESVIDRCIESVVSQKIPGLEYIIIDGASTDSTLEKIRKWGNKISIVLSEPDNGLYDAMNKGLKMARGKYIHFLNADDRYVANDTLLLLLPKLDEQSVCYGVMIYQETNGGRRRLGSSFNFRQELIESRIPQPTLFVPSKLYQQVGEFDLQYRIAADYDMVLRLTRHFSVRFIDQPITLMMAGGISYTRMGQTFREATKVSIRHGRSPAAAYFTYLRRLLTWQIARVVPVWFIEIKRGIRFQS